MDDRNLELEGLVKNNNNNKFDNVCKYKCEKIYFNLINS